MHSDDSYNLHALEDLFECIEILSKARALLGETNPDLASDLAKVTNTLVLFHDPDPVKQQERSNGAGSNSDNETIVDVLTGEVVYVGKSQF